TADEQGNISMRALADDREILHLKGPGIQVASVVFSPDGDYLEATYPLESKSNRSRILVWDLQRGEIAFRLTPDRAGSTVVWGPDSRRFAVHSGAMITLLDVILRKEIRRFSFSTSVDLIAF